DGGWARSEKIQEALRTVPRHRFAPEAGLATAYDGGDRAVITRRDGAGKATSSVSAAWLQADMIENLRLVAGAVVVEAGSGGYNRAIAFERRGQVLHARSFTHCGFVRDQGQHARTIPVVGFLDGELTLRFEHGTAAPTKGLEEALRGPRHEVTTGVTMGSG